MSKSEIPALTQIKKCVTFIFLKNKKGEYVPNGTGFFTGIKANLPGNLVHIYLVTAKHVIQDTNRNFYPLIVIRLNTKTGSSEFLEIPTNEINILTHSDVDVDIAVVPLAPDEKIFDFMHLEETAITTKQSLQELKIAEGTDVLFSGLFTSHIGQKKNQPIIRFGKVALISDEKIEWRINNSTTKLLDLYLLECQSFGGNSGSPVFFRLDPLREIKEKKIKFEAFYLAGIMTGSFISNTKIDISSFVDTAYSFQNIGIAAVTPSYKLHEILFSKDAVALRDIAEKKTQS